MFRRFSACTANAAGSAWAFTAAAGLVIAWAVAGPFFRFSEEWQIVINTATTIITFLMVFLIQATQNRDTAAMQAKLDELIRSHKEANNALIRVEEKD